MSSDQESFWKRYYDELAPTAPHWLDYSNERVQAQSISLALEAAGPIGGRRCLDLGCGLGHLCNALDALGARSVLGIDVSQAAIEHDSAASPQLQWRVGNLSAVSDDERFDLVFLVEILQYVAFEATLARAWSILNAGGRLVVVVPNRDCSIVTKTIDRFDTNYAPPTAGQVTRVLGSLSDTAGWGIRGLFFQADQTLLPYGCSPWTDTPNWPTVPNRLQFTAIKAD